MKIKKTGYEGPKCKKPTTNAAPDTHQEFCARCEKYNHGCPIGIRNMKKCSL